jgi:DNA-binding XRE family transcriptional regulator
MNHPDGEPIRDLQGYAHGLPRSPHPRLQPRPAPGAGGLLRALRRERGLAAGDVARHLGVHPATVTRWELGQRRPTDPARLNRLLDLLRPGGSVRRQVVSRLAADRRE